LDLVDGRGDELAAEHDVREEDGEVALGLGVSVLLVQHVPRDGHQVRVLRLSRVVHLAPRRASHSLLQLLQRRQWNAEQRARETAAPHRPDYLVRAPTDTSRRAARWPPPLRQRGEKVRLGARRGLSLLYLSAASGARSVVVPSRAANVGTVAEGEALVRGGALADEMAGWEEGANTGWFDEDLWLA
jgi:hypothetical protein